MNRRMSKKRSSHRRNSDSLSMDKSIQENTDIFDKNLNEVAIALESARERQKLRTKMSAVNSQ